MNVRTCNYFVNAVMQAKTIERTEKAKLQVAWSDYCHFSQVAMTGCVAVRLILSWRHMHLLGVEHEQ